MLRTVYEMQDTEWFRGDCADDRGGGDTGAV
jgi:hypothetical protein